MRQMLKLILYWKTETNEVGMVKLKIFFHWATSCKDSLPRLYLSKYRINSV